MLAQTQGTYGGVLESRRCICRSRIEARTLNEKTQKQPKPYTPAQLRAFDRVTMKACSRDQMKRIAARIEYQKFLDQLGVATCDAMYEVLRKRDERKGR
jgi:predicted nucleic acid-binding OB-fold protein